LAKTQNNADITVDICERKIAALDRRLGKIEKAIGVCRDWRMVKKERLTTENSRKEKSDCEVRHWKKKG
jgi:hypothetical protein